MTDDNPVKTGDLSEDVRPLVRGENIVVSMRSVWGIFAAVGVCAIFIIRMNFQVEWLRQEVSRVNTRLTQLDVITDLRTQISSLKENGSDQVKLLSTELSRLRHDFDVHVAETTTRPSK